MSNLFKEVLSMSLSGTLLILLIMLLKPVLKNRFTKAWQYYIWIIVLIRLLVPFSPEFGIVGNLIQSLSAPEINVEQSNTDASVGQTGAGKSQNISDNNVNEENLTAIRQNESIMPLNLWNLGSYLWLFGIVILFAIKMVRYLHFLKFIKNSAEPIADKRILQIYKGVADELGIIKRPQLKLSSQIASPMLIGLFNSSIYLTVITAGWDDSSLYYVLRHELMHFKRHDLWYKWSSDLILCLHWFNPLVYLMNRFINSQCEISCDEAVARNLSPEEKMAYGNVLLNAVSENLKNHRQALYSTLYEDKKSMKERIKSIIMSKQKSKKTIIPSIIVTIALCITAFLLGAYTMNGGNLNSGTKANAANGQNTVNGSSADSVEDSANQGNSVENTGNTDESQNNGTIFQSTDGITQNSATNANSSSNADASENNTGSQAGSVSSGSSDSNGSVSDNSVSGSSSGNSSSTSTTSGNSTSGNSGGDKVTATGSGNKSSNNDSTLTYSNTDFGFDFTLPSSWKGYTILKDTWQGTAISGKHAGELTESGTKLLIRHPEWTEEVPRQDIPIMIFTKEQWDKVEKEEIAVSAAPIGPSKLGSNSKYVFALPARYNFAFPEGFEEVEKIMESNPLSANESFK